MTRLDLHPRITHPHNFTSTMQPRPSHSSPTQLHLHHAATTISQLTHATSPPPCSHDHLTAHPHSPHLHHATAPLSHPTLTAHKAPTRPPYSPPIAPLIFKPTKSTFLPTSSTVHPSWNSAPMQPTLISQTPTPFTTIPHPTIQLTYGLTSSPCSRTPPHAAHIHQSPPHNPYATQGLNLATLQRPCSGHVPFFCFFIILMLKFHFFTYVIHSFYYSEITF